MGRTRNLNGFLRLSILIVSLFLLACSTSETSNIINTGDYFADLDSDLSEHDAENSEPQVLLFAYFQAFGLDPGDGLHLAWSLDGYNFEALNNGDVVLARPEGMSFRDPHITLGPDGTFHLVWTAKERSIGYAESIDLVTWSKPRLLPVMENEPDARNCWAPETFYDSKSELFYILWSTTIPGRFPDTDDTGDDGFNHRIYATNTEDFETFSETFLFYDPGFNVIDASLVQDVDRILMFVKNETLSPEPAKYIYMASADSLAGPWEAPGEPITPAWMEGPSVVRINNTWHLYCDYYAMGQYELVTSTDLTEWTQETNSLTMPENGRHGTVLWVPERIISPLLTSE